MWGYGYNMMGWGWVIGAVLVALLVVAVVVVLRFVAVRANSSGTAPQPVATEPSTPRQILDERYAKGDLTTDEYREHVSQMGSA